MVGTYLLVVVASLADTAIHALSRAGTPMLALLWSKYECTFGSPLTTPFPHVGHSGLAKPIPTTSLLHSPTPDPVIFNLCIEPLGPNTH